MELPYIVRPYDTADLAFVHGSFTRGARRPFADLEGATIMVAHHANDSDALLGWAATQNGCVVWVYVRDLQGKDGGVTARGRGIAGALLRALGVDLREPTPCRHWSPAATEIAMAGKYRPVYAP